MTFTLPDALPFGAAGWRGLVEAVAAADDSAVESHCLERKGNEPLTSKPTRAKVAKFILATANRPVQLASSAMAGHAVMFLGVSHNAVTGIPKMEDHDIEAGLLKYLGDSQPSWEVVHVPVDEARDVIAIVVRPPQQGDPMWICRAEGEDLRDGAIYIRTSSNTRNATSAEIEHLQERAAGAAVSMGFTVEFDGEIFFLTYDESIVDEFVAAESSRLLGALQKSGDTDIMSVLNKSGYGSIMAGMKRKEKRTEEQFRAQVTKYLKKLKAELPKLAATLGARRPAPIWRISNAPSGFHTGVEVVIHLEGDVFAHDHTDSDLVPSLRNVVLPKPPETWGDKYDDMAQRIMLPHAAQMPTFRSARPTISWRNSGSVTMTTPTFDLRPGKAWKFDASDDSPVLYTLDPELREIHCTWSATAGGFHEQISGELTIPVAGVLDVSENLRRLLFS